MNQNKKLEYFWRTHISHSKSFTRKAAIVATHYAEQMSAAETCMKTNITDLDIYEQQVKCETTPPTLMAHAIRDRHNTLLKCKKAHLAMIKFHLTMISNGIETDIDLPQKLIYIQ
jgi:hypothetical protein